MVSVLSQTPQATSEASYQYAYDGKRNSKYIDGTLYDYTYTGSNLLETYADTAGRIAKYTYGNALISQTNASGDSYSILTDYQNSVIALLNPSTIHGPLSTAFAYDPFGKLRYTNNPDSPQTLGWLSRQFDSETGNHYLINRYYNADRGSFLSPDQYQYVNNATPFTFNLYQYGYANPLVNVDTEGNIPRLGSWVREQQQIQQIKHEDRAAFERMLKRIGMTEDMFNESEERGFHHVGNGIFRHKQMFDLNILYGTGLFAPEHEVITEWKWEENGKKLTLQRAWPASKNPKGIEAETGIFNLLFGAKAIQFGYEAMGIRGALMQGFDEIVGLPVTDTARLTTKLANPRTWRAFNRDILQHETTESSGFFSKLLRDERGFVRIGKEELEDKGVYPLLTQRGVLWKSSKTGKFVAAPGRGVTVLGHWDDYVIEARKIGATYYSLPKVTWDRLTRGERWELNQLFLDKAIERGDTFIFATHWEKKFSYFGRELWYLRKKGIDVSAVEKRWGSGF